MTQWPHRKHKQASRAGPQQGDRAGLYLDRPQASSSLPQNHESSWLQPSLQMGSQAIH